MYVRFRVRVKFVVKKDGIFFKFARDNNGLYGNDDFKAMKAGSHEFRSLMMFMDCRIPGLHFPLVVIIDYRYFIDCIKLTLPEGGD
jgi:hypothetical protein